MLKLKQNKAKLERDISKLLIKFHLDNNLISDENVTVCIGYSYKDSEGVSILDDIHVSCDIII
ncbi:hypothetical protein [Tenacibaculum phage JQ]|nr:hypothetical protein [Tenacibaculum phage JQ]